MGHPHAVALLALVAGLVLPSCRAEDPPAAAPESSSQERVEGWGRDIDTLLAEIRRQHYLFRDRPLPAEMVAAGERLRGEIPRFSDERMLAELQRLAVFAGDGHTYVLPFGAARVPSHWLPLRFYLFSDGLFVIDAAAGHERRIGSRVVRLGDTSAEQAMARVRELVSRDNEQGVNWIGPVLLSFLGPLQAATDGLGADHPRLTLETEGETSEVTLAPVPVPRMRGLPKLVPSKRPGAAPAPLYLEDVATPHWMRPLPEARALYLQFNQVMDAPDQSLAELAARLEAEIARLAPAHLIVDVRHNNGGNADLLGPLVAALDHFASRPGHRLFVLTGRNTFSAAQIFIARVDHSGRAVFVGEHSSSRPNFVGEENGLQLPWSGAIVSISNRYHETIPGDSRSSIEPAIRVELSAADYFANRDPVLEAVLAEIRKPVRSGG